MQDFRCRKTHMVSQRLGSAYSGLCEPLQMDHPPATLREQLGLLMQVAKLHGFGYLKESIDEVLLMQA